MGQISWNKLWSNGLWLQCLPLLLTLSVQEKYPPLVLNWSWIHAGVLHCFMNEVAHKSKQSEMLRHKPPPPSEDIFVGKKYPRGCVFTLLPADVCGECSCGADGPFENTHHTPSHPCRCLSLRSASLLSTEDTVLVRDSLLKCPAPLGETQWQDFCALAARLSSSCPP